MKATLVLEDGSSFDGISIAAKGERIGEVVLNTAVVGYQEMITDPANAGRILVLTYPLIGNYGVAKKFNESPQCWLSGLVIKESSRIYSNWQAEGPFEDFLKSHKVLTASGVDTRTLAVRIRDNGEMLGIISTENSRKEDLLKRLKSARENYRKDFIKDISVKKPVEIKSGNPGPRIAILDLGITGSIIRQLGNLGCNIVLMPYNTAADEFVKMRPDGLLISGGPEGDEALKQIAGTVKTMMGKIPMLGVSTGHHVISLALGCEPVRMKVGHHGVNYPAKGPDCFKGHITVQNHSYVVDDKSLKQKKDVNVTLRNINDNTIEEIESRSLKFISVQYNPSSPGLDEVNEVFVRFLNMIDPKHKKQLSKHCAEVQYAKA